LPEGGWWGKVLRRDGMGVDQTVTVARGVYPQFTRR